jgi:hypothetical protein
MASELVKSVLSKEKKDEPRSSEGRTLSKVGASHKIKNNI